MRPILDRTPLAISNLETIAITKTTQQQMHQHNMDSGRNTKNPKIHTTFSKAQFFFLKNLSCEQQQKGIEIYMYARITNWTGGKKHGNHPLTSHIPFIILWCYIIHLVPSSASSHNHIETTGEKCQFWNQSQRIEFDLKSNSALVIFASKWKQLKTFEIYEIETFYLSVCVCNRMLRCSQAVLNVYVLKKYVRIIQRLASVHLLKIWPSYFSWPESVRQ